MVAVRIGIGIVIGMGMRCHGGSGNITMTTNDSHEGWSKWFGDCHEL